jgi:hypothetical protein
LVERLCIRLRKITKIEVADIGQVFRIFRATQDRSCPVPTLKAIGVLQLAARRFVVLGQPQR